MDETLHWNTVYQTKAPDAVSWYTPHLDTSLSLIEKTAGSASAAIIDVGGGEATLVDDLLARGYADITVLDISQAAIEVAKQRVGNAGQQVDWLVADITQVALPEKRYDVWHDRAVFHFLTRPEQRQAYVHQVARAMRPGGSVIVATFGPEGPGKCSGLDIVRYDASTLHHQFGPRFRLIDSRIEQHTTPFGTTQQFVYCFCRVA
jgi:2-polyprenyl-3-methyl-5-hydroxy-6-metoxy-1,4-benzoquinol methylase